MNKYTITAPEGFEAIETIVDGVTNISFIPKVVEKELPTNLNKSISYLPETCYYIAENGYIMDFEIKLVSDITLREPNIITSKEYAEAFLALMQLVRFRDIWNEDWIPDWTNSTIKKFTIQVNYDYIIKNFGFILSDVLAFKTEELRDKFLETFKHLIETAKPLL